MDSLEAYAKARESFGKLAATSTAIVLLLAAASRLPAWEVASPVGWLVGSVNVGFLPIFGPIIALGASCNVYLALREVSDLRTAVLRDTGVNRTEYAAVLLQPPRGSKRYRDPRFVIASRTLLLWNFWVPVLAYLILMSTYFDFVRPKPGESSVAQYDGRPRQIADLLVGLGGWSGFRPILPSIQASLAERERTAKDTVEAQRLREVAKSIPWIYPPGQTWAYLGGLGLIVYMSVGGWKLRWPDE